MRFIALLALLVLALPSVAAGLLFSTTPKTVSTFAVLNSATVKGKINVRLEGCGDVAPIKFYIDNVGVTLYWQEGSCTYGMLGDDELWDTTKYTDGAHFIYVTRANGTPYRADFTIKNATTPACTAPQPSVEYQTAQCPVGTYGQIWNQTRTYVPAPYPTCWTASAWTPATGNCVAPFTLTASVTPPSVYRGSPVTFAWSASDALAQCVTPAGAGAASGSLTLTPSQAETIYQVYCAHGTVGMGTAAKVWLYERPIFAHQCSPYPVTKLTPIYPIPAGTSARYNALVIQDCVVPGGGRVVEGIFTNYPPSTFSIPGTWSDVQATPSEAAYGHAQVLAYKAAHP